MNPIKSLCAIVLTFSLIAAMAFLPFLLGRMEDRRFHSAPSFAEMPPVTLKMDNNILHPLMLLSELYNSHEISPEQAILTTSELQAFLSEGLKPYMECGILPFSLDFTVEPELAKPYLVYDSISDAAQGSVVWIIILDVVDQGSIEIILDDQTGKILLLTCSTQNYFGKIPCSPENALHLYLNTYLDGLDVENLYTEILDYDNDGTLHHIEVILRLPDLSGYILISFLADVWGLNMQIQAEYTDGVTKNK